MKFCPHLHEEKELGVIFDCERIGVDLCCGEEQTLGPCDAGWSLAAGGSISKSMVRDVGGIEGAGSMTSTLCDFGR